MLVVCKELFANSYAFLSFFLCGKQLHNSYHRHSVSNLITITPAKTTVTITPTAPISQHQKVSSYIGLHLSSQSTPHSTLSTNSSGNSVTTPISSLAPMNYCKYYHSFFLCACVFLLFVFLVLFEMKSNDFFFSTNWFFYVINPIILNIKVRINVQVKWQRRWHQSDDQVQRAVVVTISKPPAKIYSVILVHTEI